MFFTRATPVSASQKRLIAQQRNHLEMIPLRADLDYSLLANTLQQIVQDSESLRLSFNESGEYCFVSETVKSGLMAIDLVGKKNGLEDFIEEQSRIPFNLFQKPLFRFFLLRQSGEQRKLLLVVPEVVKQDPQFSHVQSMLQSLKNPDELLEGIRLLWKQVMNFDSIKDDDNFFRLGGHSLLAVELAEKLRDEFNKDIYIRDIFEYPTIAQLKGRLEQLGVKTKTYEIVVSNSTSGPLSYNQTQVWYVEKLFPEIKMHNLSTSLRIKWKVDPKVIEKTIHYFFKRHSALRTIIKDDGEVPCQVVLPETELVFNRPLEVVKTKENLVMGLMRQETQVPFDLSVAPLFRYKLYELGKDDYFFFFMVHHAVWDGWCFDIFFEEFALIYAAFDKGAEPVFHKDPIVSYLDFSQGQLNMVQSGQLNHEIDYWKNKLTGPLPILEIPTDFPRPKTPSHDGGNFRFAFSASQIESIKDYAANNNSSVFNVLLTAYKVAMSKVCGLQDIIVGSPIRGRNQSELGQTIGYFVNTLALRSHIDPKLSFEHNLATVTTTCLEAYSHQEIPFEVLLKEIKYKRDMSRTAIFQTYFTFQDMTNRQFSIDGREVKQVSVNNASVKTDFDIWVKVTTTSIEGAFEYRSDLYKEATVKEFYNVFVGIINQIGEKNTSNDIYLIHSDNQAVPEALAPVGKTEPTGAFARVFFRLRNLFYRYFEFKQPTS